MLGVALGFAAELLDPTLRTMQDFQRVYSGPVLGTTPLVERVQEAPSRVKRYWVPAAVTGIIVLTLLFFIGRETVLKDTTTFDRAVQVVDPEAQTR